MTEKQCIRCKEEWPLDAEFFYREKSKPGGFANYCKACYAEMPSGRKKTASRQVFRIHSSWESLFPEYQERRA